MHPPAEWKKRVRLSHSAFGDRMQIKLFNTMGREKQVFKPIKPGEVKIYSCGPTVYDYAHMGHFFAYVFVDILKRVMKEYRLNFTLELSLFFEIWQCCESE